ncbi:MAG: outer membrane beta-barrel protein [Rhodobacterales bacterium]|nr:outer membrane beta-barrel protein [Rhodobacterales bacterium]NCT11465.1 outer membrane beta-barrel protein [Rhodobacterales bacterium]
MKTIALFALASGLVPGLAAAEVELSFYGGWQSAPHSDVSIRGDSVIADGDFTAGWEGRSFSAPPYYGLRATWWQNERFGFGVELNHAKVYADATTLAVSGLDRFEFSDGLNILTVNAFRRWEDSIAGFTPYVGGGIGVSVPHVEVFEGGSRTFEYQLTGPAVAWMAGASYPITDSFSVFGEYKGTYSINSATLDGGGTLETDIITNAINLGVSFNF